VRTVAGMIAVNLAFVPPGGALLYALGLVRAGRRSTVLAATGPAFFCGVALVVPLLICLLVIGVALTLVTLVLVSAAATVALLLAGKWLWLAPSFLVAAIVALGVGAVRRVASFYLCAAAGLTFALLWAYWTSGNDINWYLRYSVDRTVSGIVFVAAIGAANLTSVLGARDAT
jgi:hypothetical protein